jgi:hypothetical protein
MELLSGARSRLARIFGQDQALPPVAAATQPIDPVPAVLRAYGDMARAQGIDRLYLFLSFDCDTDLDVPASLEAHDFLSRLGIKMTMAVPGAQLERGAETYRSLAERGVEFMNHGGLPHAEWKVDQYVGRTFYSEMAVPGITADIEAGHEIVTRVIGRAPTGFRAPHFGCFQAPAQLDLIYRTVGRLGYRYCSTTTPATGLEHGPLVQRGDMVELPAFGSVLAPTTILDSWTYLANRKVYALGDQYYDLVEQTVRVLRENDIPGILTWYADPCHVAGQAPFHRAMELIARAGIPSLGGAECAELARRPI